MTAPRTEYEEWRLTFELPESPHTADAFIAQVRPQVPRDVDIHRTGRRGIRLYATTRTNIDSASETVMERLAAWRLHTPIELRRWNPGAERWQEPSLPIEPARQPAPDPWANFGEMAWEVRLRFENSQEAARLAQSLREEGAAVLDGWKRFLVALPDESAARQLADELRLAAPRAEIEVRAISRFRRWTISQRVHGNYAG